MVYIVGSRRLTFYSLQRIKVVCVMSENDFGCLLVIIAVAGAFAIPTVAPWWSVLVWLGGIAILALVAYAIRALARGGSDQKRDDLT